MSKFLVICESPGKVNLIQKYLGDEYKVLASYGHIFDLPEKKIGVDIKNDFNPTFVVKNDKKTVLNSIIQAAKKSTSVYLLTDPDREGAGIAKHIYDYLKENTKSVKIYRAQTNEITKAGVNEAIQKCGDIDEDVVNAYLARRILDRICGYKTSYLTQSATGGRSAGRVQSAILRIIADRELEIKQFVPVEYWVLSALLSTNKKEQYTGILTDKIEIKNENEALDIYNKVVYGSPCVKSVDSKTVASNPYPPFTTLPMIATANTVLGFSAKKTMQVAQSLYESGRCTYLRTDSPFMSAEATESVRSYISNTYGNEYLPSQPKHYAAKKGAQEAHECCRPTDFSFHWHSLSNSDEAKLYELIWKRAVSSQMNSGQDKRTKIITDIAGYDFHTNGNIMVFDGWRKCWTYSSSKDSILPELTVGDKCSLDKLNKEQKFTSPPPRFTDASLSKKCEDEQIARPATFASFVDTLKNRGYIENKKSISATELGIKVIQFLKAADICFVDIKFTSNMESLLDEIQSGNKNKIEVLSEFWKRLQEDIQRGQEIKSNQSVTEFKCPKCGACLAAKFSKFGKFLACTNYSNKEKKCNYKTQADENGNPCQKKEPVLGSHECPQCSSQMYVRTSKHGSFQGCSKYPKCNGMRTTEGEIILPKEKKGYKKSNKKTG